MTKEWDGEYSSLLASEKWCPFVRLRLDTQEDGQHHKITGWNRVKESDGSASWPRAACCVREHCMAWRGTGHEIKEIAGQEKRYEIGYCGLAGPPESRRRKGLFG